MIPTGCPDRRQEHREGGAAAVEFALILPILIALLIGIIDFGLTFNTQIALTQAAREGVRVEALHFNDDDHSETDVKDRTKEAFLSAYASGDDIDNIDVTSCPNDEGAKVRATLEFSTGLLDLGPFTLTGEAVMRCGG